MEEGEDAIVVEELKGFKKFLYTFLGVDQVIYQLQRSNERLKRDVRYGDDSAKSYQAEIERLKNHNRELIENKFDVHNDSVAFDFMNPEIIVASVERTWNEKAKHTQTVIGYKNNEGALREWFFNVSEEKHKALVLEFQSSLATKRMKGK